METRVQSRYNRVVADTWGEGAPDSHSGFYGLPALRAYHQEELTGIKGPAAREWYEQWAVDTVLGKRAPVGRCLSLACGFGEIERILARLGAFERCTAVDISEGAIRGAREAAERAGLRNIEYRVADLNRDTFEPGSYDLVWSNGALHHVADLDHAVGQLHRALRPGGILVANEYVGPRHYDIPHRQRELVNAVIHLLPSRLRDHTEESFVPGWFSDRLWRLQLWYALRLVTGRAPRLHVNTAWPPRKRRLAELYNAFPRRAPRQPRRFRFRQVWDRRGYYFVDRDPSEGVRSDMIVPTLRRVFGDLEVRTYNGGLLFHALGPRFYASFDDGRAEDRQLLEMLIAIERAYVATGEVPSENAHMVARKG